MMTGVRTEGFVEEAKDDTSRIRTIHLGKEELSG